MGTGSYQFESMPDQAFQSDRLRLQAMAVRRIEASILKQAGLQPDHHVLEIGSGPGFVSDLLAELAPEGRLTAVEPSGALLEQVSNNVRQAPKGGLQLVQAYGNDLPLPDSSADFAYTRFVLQHVPQPESVIVEVCRVLRSGGRFCAVDSDDGLIVCHPEDERVTRIVQHAQVNQREQGGDRFIGRKLQSLMVQAGFKNVKSRVLALTSSELPFEVLFNILLGYKATHLGGDVDLKQLFADLSQQDKTGNLMLAGGVFIVVGEKP